MKEINKRKEIKDEDDLTLLREYVMRFSIWSICIFGLEIFIAWCFFIISKPLFLIYLLGYIIYLIFPSGYAKKRTIIENELKRRGLV